MKKYYAICDKDDHPIFQSILMKDVAEFAGVTSSSICHALKRKEAGFCSTAGTRSSKTLMKRMNDEQQTSGAAPA